MLELDYAPPPPVFHLKKFSVEQYLRLVDSGQLDENERIELIHGWLVQKMSLNASHKTSLRNLHEALIAFAMSDLVVDNQGPVILDDSVPEPDLTISIGPAKRYTSRLPVAEEVLTIIEIADSSLDYDQTTKLELYASAGIPIYWVVNLIDKRVEVYTKPKGGKKPGYGKVTKYKPGDDMPVMIAGKKRGTIAVSAILP